MASPDKENADRLIIIILSDEMKDIYLGFLNTLQKRGKLICMTETDITANVTGLPTLRLPALRLRDAEPYECIAKAHQCIPKRSIVIAMDPNHMEAANKAGFQVVCVHKGELEGKKKGYVSGDTECSFYNTIILAGEEISFIAKKMWLDDAMDMLLGKAPPENLLPFRIRGNNIEPG